MKMRPEIGDTTVAYATRLGEKAPECDLGTDCDERILEHLIQTFGNKSLIQKCTPKSWTLQECLIEAGQFEDILLQMRYMKIRPDDKHTAKVEESRRRTTRTHKNPRNNNRRYHDQLRRITVLSLVLRGRAAPTARDTIVARDIIISQPCAGYAIT